MNENLNKEDLQKSEFQQWNARRSLFRELQRYFKQRQQNFIVIIDF